MTECITESRAGASQVMSGWGCAWVKGISDREQPLQNCIESARGRAKVSEGLLPRYRAHHTLTLVKHKARLPHAFYWHAAWVVRLNDSGKPSESL